MKFHRLRLRSALPAVQLRVRDLQTALPAVQLRVRDLQTTRAVLSARINIYFFVL